MSFPLRSPLVLISILLLALMPEQARAGAAEVHRDLLESVRAIEPMLPQLTASAERAATMFVEDDARIAVGGEVSFIRELQGRSGGLMRLEKLPAGDGAWTGIVLYAPTAKTIEADACGASEASAAS